MKYSLVKGNNLICGPVDWSAYIFQRALLDEDIVATLPVDEPTEVIIFNTVKLYPTKVVSATLALDEYVSGYELTFEDTILYYTELKDVLSSQEINNKIVAKRNELKESIRIKRRAIEQGGITVIVEDIPCVFATDRDSQGMLARTEQYMTDPVNWKLANGNWIVINKSYMTYIVTKLNEHIQSCFTKEYSLVEKVDKLLLEDLFNFNIDKEWSNI